MTSQPLRGGRRPIDRVLTPEFADDLGALPFEEVRERRQLAEQEEVELSYSRRLLQGRLDLLRAERGRRQSPEGAVQGQRSDAELARDLAAALTDGPRSSHGLGRHLTIDPTRVGEHRRAAEQAVDNIAASDPSALDDESISEAIIQLSELEQTLSDNRHRVQTVMDLLTFEVGRRYREGEVSVDDVLTVD